MQFQAVLPDLVAKRLWRLGEPLVGFPVRRIRDTGYFDVDSLERQKMSDVLKM
jgi:hypothetical protein